MVCAQATIEVEVPLRRAYDAWADIAQHVRFVSGVQRAEPVDEVTWRLHGQGPGGQRAWTIRVAQRSEDEHVTIHTLDGPWDAMVVLFERLAPDRTAVTLLRDHEAEVGPDPDVDAIVRRDLQSFRQAVESEQTGHPATAPPLLHGL